VRELASKHEVQEVAFDFSGTQGSPGPLSG
jgi:hypothetical protein